MKTNLTRRFLPLAVLAALGLRASAAVLNFDPDADASNNDCTLGTGLGGPGTWDATTANWADSANCGVDSTWVDGSSVVFWPPAGPITTTTPFTVGNMTFNATGFVLSGTNLTLTSGATLTKTSTGLATISTPIAGTGGYNIAGAGKISIQSYPNTITGPINIGTGATLKVPTGLALGSPTSGDITLNGGTLENDDNGGIGSNGSGDLLFLDNNSSRNLVLDSVNGGTITLGGSGGLHLLAWPNKGNSHIKGGPLLLNTVGGGYMSFRVVTTGQTFSKLTVSGPVAYNNNAGTATDDTVFGKLPSVYTPDAITLTNGGVLQFGAGVTINANRGITVGANSSDVGYFHCASGVVPSINSPITGPGGISFGYPTASFLNNSSSGAYLLNASNSWQGTTYIVAGNTVANVPGALPHTPLVIDPTGTSSYSISKKLTIATGVTASVPNISGPVKSGGATGTVAINSGATFIVGDDNTTTGYGGIIANAGGTFIKTGTGTLIISNGWTSSAACTNIIDQGTILYGASAAGMPSGGTGVTSISAGATLNGNGAVGGGATVSYIAGAGTVTNCTPGLTLNGTALSVYPPIEFSGTIAGPGIVTHSGAGTQTLSGVNTFTNLTQSAGRLNINNQGAPGAGVIYVTGNSTIGTTVAMDITNSIILTNNKLLTLTAATNGGSLTIDGIISGAGTIKRDATDGGPVTLNGANTFTNGVQLTALQLNIGNASALGTGTFTNNGTGQFDNTSGSDLTIANLTRADGGGLHYVGSANNLTINTVLLTAASRNMTVDGHSLIVGALNQDAAGRGYVKLGVGTLEVDGAATYTGPTVVTNGTLAVNGNIASSSGVSVYSGSSLVGSGTVPAVTLNSGATISAGFNGVGTLTSGNQTWNGGSTYQWDIADAGGAAGVGFDTINAAALTIGATPASPMTIKITGTPANFPGAGSWVIASSTGISGFDYRSFVIDTTGLSATLDPHKAFRVTQSGGNLVLTYSDPAITADPANTVVSHGSNAVFSVSAVGNSLTYQWQKNGVNITDGGTVSGSTTSSLTIANVADGDVGSYDVVVTDSTIPQSVTSAVATLHIVDAPVITAQPASTTVGTGTNTSFLISWNGSADDIANGFTTIKWQHNGANINDGAKYTGTATTNLAITSPVTADAGSYTITLSNVMGTATSTAAVLGVDLAPAITRQPTSATITPYGGFTTNTSVAATGGDLTYQWLVATATSTNALVEDANNYIGTATANLVITNAVDTNSGSYFVIITNHAGSITSAVAVITVPVDPVVTTSPVSQSAVTGSTVVFTAVASGKPNLFYHWKANGNNLVDNGTHVIGANSQSLTLANVTPADNASLVLEVTNDFDNAFADSTAATLTVFDPATFSGGTYADGVLGGRTYTNGNTVTLTAPVTGSSLTYKWQKNGANISGATAATYTIASVTLADQGSYALIANNWAGSATSTPPAVVVVDQAPAITTQPSSITVDVAGDSAKFTVVATGNPLNYQWYFNSNAIAGATSASYTIGSVSSANIGFYHVVVGNLISSVKSTVVTLKIGKPAFLTDDLTTDTSANWNVYTNHTDGTATFAFDYSLRNDNSGPGVPQNPNTTTSKALKLTIDELNYGPNDAITLTPKTINATGDYQISFDVFMNIQGQSSGGVTEQAFTAGLGCTPATTNWWNTSLGGGTTSNGVVVAANCGNQTSDDYMMFRNTSASATSALAPNNVMNAGTVDNSNPYYSFMTGGATINIPSTETQSTLDLAANQHNTIDFPVGIFGLKWHHVVIKRTGSGTANTNVTWYVDNVPMGTVTNAYFAPNGNSVSIGLAALVSTATAGSTNWEFTLFNNLKVQNFDGSGIAPTITTPVADTTVNAGSTATLSVAATSPTTLRYQWYKNGAEITGATASSYSINAAYAVDAGTYSVNVYNDSDFVSGGSAVLTVIDPAITAQPADVTAECGDNAVLSVSAIGSGTLSYQWYTPDATGTAIAGANSSTLTVTASGTNTYAVVVTGSAGTATSSTATVTAVDTTAPVVTVTGNVNDTVCLNSGPYADAGATYTDACSGNGAATVSGSVDTTTVGVYTLTYSAQDAANNVGTATRVVNVIDCSIAITTQPLDQLHQPQGTNVTLSVAATGNSLSYQWYLNGAAVNGANGTSFSFAAQPDQVTGTNLTAYVVVSNPWTTVQSSVAHVNIIIDKVKPTLTLISPANNNRATSFTVKGKVTDSKGNGALLKYYWTALPLTTPPAQTATYTIDISNVGTTPSSRDFSATGFPLQNPTDAGTNQLTIWTEDLAGNDSSPVKNVKVFYQVPHTYALTISGDGTGTVAVSTKGAAHETVTGAPTGTIVGSANHTYNLTLFARQDYTFKFTADPKADKPTVGISVGSVVSNALPAQAAGTTTTKPVSITFEAANADASANVSFDRNRFLDMAGTYTGVFSGTPNAPTKDNSRQFVLTVSPTRTVSGYLLDANKAKTTIPPKTSLRDDGSITVAIGSITVSGSLGWTGSENATGIKQFVGTATDGNWTAQLTADKEDKTALPTDGFATMQIPGGFAGNGFATIKSKNGVVTATYTLADDDKHPIVMAVTGSRSGNIPQWVINTHSGSLLFGNLVVGDGLATISAPSLSWIRPANNGVYPSLMPAGFTLAQFAATCSPFNPAQLLSGNYTLNLTGGSLATDINGQTVTFSGSKMTAAGKVKAGSMDANGKLKFTFLDGSTPTHTTIAQGVILQNAGNGAGFFIRTGAADTGVMTLTPVTP